MRELTKNTAYGTLLAARIIDGIGNSLYNIVFIIYAASMPFKTMAVSLASMAGLIPMLMQVVTGYAADRTQHKVQGVLWVYVAQAALFAGLALFISFPGSWPLFILLLSINIISDTLGMYAGGMLMPLLKHIVPAEELHQAVSLNSAASTTVELVFQAVGASLIVLLQHNYVVFGLINVASFALAAGIMFRQRQLLSQAEAEPAVQAQATHIQVHQSSFFRGFRDALHYLLGNRFLSVTIFLAVFINFVGASQDVMINVTLLHAQRLWIGNYGMTVAIVNTLFGVGMVLGMVFAKDGLQKLPLMTLVGLSLSMLVVVAAAFLWGGRILLCVASFLAAYMIAKVNPRLSAIVMLTVDETHMAQTSGIMGMLVMIGTPLGQALFVTLLNVTGDTTAWLVYGGLSAVIGLVAFVAARLIVEPQLPQTHSNKSKVSEAE
ncbi:MFS transporter [Lacticaseibacillus pabuli]|uniref:MFS transporter n=1 Tax=Lacticaseibacillus pabuli TaxID=3025672 RepID=A0ABY7WUS3_9LACO|nr:MFS transporter [Lacticaseibacillus sp. KACC 23028]WDF82794.1 MFS transporter [Lacticaseibacillus sp. KACC 23028]